MYGETFKSALYGAFQPADEECDPSFLVCLLEYFPTDKVDVGSGTYDQYLYDLEKTVVDNYEKGNYQVSFFYAHLIFMSYTYYCVDHAFQTNPGRMKDLFYPINPLHSIAHLYCEDKDSWYLYFLLCRGSYPTLSSQCCAKNTIPNCLEAQKQTVHQ